MVKPEFEELRLLSNIRNALFTLDPGVLDIRPYAGPSGVLLLSDPSMDSARQTSQQLCLSITSSKNPMSFRCRGMLDG